MSSAPDSQPFPFPLPACLYSTRETETGNTAGPSTIVNARPSITETGHIAEGTK